MSASVTALKQNEAPTAKNEKKNAGCGRHLQQQSNRRELQFEDICGLTTTTRPHLQRKKS